LRFEHAAQAAGLVLSSNPARDNADDAGLYLVLRGFGVRLPLDEATVVRGEDPGEGLTARHDVGLLGVRLVTLEYGLWPEAA